MGFFDSEETKESKLGECMYCGKAMMGKVGIDTGEIKYKPDEALKDETYICKECLESKGFTVGDFNKKTKAELIDIFKKKGFVSPDEFTATNRVHRIGAAITGRSDFMYMEIDEVRKLLNVPLYIQGVINDKISDRIIKWADIDDFNVLDNGVVISNVDILASGENFCGRPTGGICGSLSLKVFSKGNEYQVDFIGKELDYKKLDRIHDCKKYAEINVAMERCLDMLALSLKDKINSIKEKKIINDEKENEEEGLKQCPNCKTKYQESIKFCSSCGALLEENKQSNNTTGKTNSFAPKNAEMHEWTLRTTFGGSGDKITKITTLGTNISIEQYKSFIIKWGVKKDSFDVKDIIRLERTKKISLNSLLFLLLGIFLAMVNPIIGGICILLSLWTIHEKIIVIHHQRGLVKMPDDTNNEIKDFFTFVGVNNPSAIKNYIE